jgi:DNA-binding SARP family transcriptional activator
VLHGRVLRPVRSRRPVAQPALGAVASSQFTLISAGGAFFAEESLAKVLVGPGHKTPDQEARCAWLRLAPLDARPDHLLASLACSAGQVSGHSSRVYEMLSRTRAEGPDGWAQAGRELAANLSRGTALVIENPGHVADAAPVVAVLAGYAGSTPGMRAVLVWPGRLPATLGRCAELVLGRHELRCGSRSLGDLISQADLSLPLDTLTRLVRLAGGRAALVHDVLDAAERGNADIVTEVIATRRRRRRLMDDLTEQLLARGIPDDLEVLSTALELGYWHEGMAQGGGGAPTRGLRPWLVPLEEGWFRLRPMWAGALRRCLGAARSARSVAPDVGVLASVAPASAATGSQRAATTTHPPASCEATPQAADVGKVAGRGSQTSLEARLFGSFEIAINGEPIDRWRSQRGLIVFKYLLVHRGRPCPRDLLMDVFWPDVPPQQAKNRLHVALSGLRQTLRGVVDVPVVEFHCGLYRLNAELAVTLDVDEFDRSVAAGKRAEVPGDIGAALGAYEEAVSLYRGDLLADTPYDDWAVLPRETRRTTYLDVLDRMTSLYLANNQIPECIAAARLILCQDDCREDAHRLLMRCYALQGRFHQAIRQFEVCRSTLQATLGSLPSPPTVELHATLRTNGDELGGRILRSDLHIDGLRPSRSTRKDSAEHSGR